MIFILELEISQCSCLKEMMLCKDSSIILTKKWQEMQIGILSALRKIELRFIWELLVQVASEIFQPI